MIRITILTAAVLSLSACATVSPPIVDTKGADPARYQVDLSECNALADQAPRPAGINELMGVNASMRQVTIRMCLVQRGWRLVG